MLVLVLVLVVLASPSPLCNCGNCNKWFGCEPKATLDNCRLDLNKCISVPATHNGNAQYPHNNQRTDLSPPLSLTVLLLPSHHTQWGIVISSSVCTADINKYSLPFAKARKCVYVPLSLSFSRDTFSAALLARPLGNYFRERVREPNFR